MKAELERLTEEGDLDGASKMRAIINGMTKGVPKMNGHRDD